MATPAPSQPHHIRRLVLSWRPTSLITRIHILTIIVAISSLFEISLATATTALHFSSSSTLPVTRHITDDVVIISPNHNTAHTADNNNNNTIHIAARLTAPIDTNNADKTNVITAQATPATPQGTEPDPNTTTQPAPALAKKAEEKPTPTPNATTFTPYFSSWAYGSTGQQLIGGFLIGAVGMCAAWLAAFGAGVVVWGLVRGWRAVGGLRREGSWLIGGL